MKFTIEELKRMREVAKRTQQGNWTIETIEKRFLAVTIEGNVDDPCICDVEFAWPIGFTTDLKKIECELRARSNLEHICTFDPPTAIALLDRLIELEG